MIIVESRAVPPFEKNGFVVSCPVTREGVLIDPGDEVDGLLAYAANQKVTLTHILLTHAHIDHITGVGVAKAATGAPIYLHAADRPLYEAAAEQATMFGLHLANPLPPVDVYYLEQGAIQFGQCAATPYHTPGHCPGGVCLRIGDGTEPAPQLFVGDTLFAGSIGRTDLPGGDYATLMRSIFEVLCRFGDEAVVLPGHGPATTIGRERRTNPFLQAR